MRMVLDCSVAVAWVFEDETSPYAEAALHHVGIYGGMVPLLFWWELTNALVTGAKRSRCTQAEVAELLDSPVWRCIASDAAPGMATLQRTATLAHHHQLTLYDASYLDLAQRRQCPLATLDKQVIRAANEAGVALLLQRA